MTQDTSSNDERTTNGLNRRQVLQALGATAAAGLAGCGSNGDGGGGSGGGSGGSDGGSSGDGGSSEMGERVPTLKYQFWSGLGATSKMMEDVAPANQARFEELGLDVEIIPSPDTVNSIHNDLRDDRHGHVNHYLHGASPGRIDPNEFCTRFGITYAGANGRGNGANYANCEYSAYARAQSLEPDPEARRELVTRCRSIASNDKIHIPLGANLLNVAWRSDRVEIGGLGARGIGFTNPWGYLMSSPTEGNEIVAQTQPSFIEFLNYFTTSDPEMLTFYNNVIGSTLTMYDENLELVNTLAESIEQPGPKETVVTLRDGITFHNGDPMTADDVKFTLEFLANNIDVLTFASEMPIDTVEVDDDLTARVLLSENFPPLTTLTFPMWSIIHRGVAEDSGLTDDPVSWSPDIDTFNAMMAGPMEALDWEADTSMVLSPYDDHPTITTDHDMSFRVYQSAASVTEAMIAGEIDMAGNLGTGNIERLNEEASDIVSTKSIPMHTPTVLNLSYHWGPTKFEAVRDALGTVINRREINALGFNGENIIDTHCAYFLETHPWRLPEEELYQYTDNPEGDVEAARAKLEEAGFSWDNNGRLHYPPDADLEPLWPQGEVPTSEYGYDCLNGDGEWVGELPSA